MSSVVGNNASINNLYVSQCKICRDGIFRPQPFEWNNNPIGLCHTVCMGDKAAGKAVK
jgi:hypothetical protein